MNRVQSVFHNLEIFGAQKISIENQCKRVAYCFLANDLNFECETDNELRIYKITKEVGT